MTRRARLAAAVATSVGAAVLPTVLPAVLPLSAPASAVPPGIDGPLLVVADHDSANHHDVYLLAPDGSSQVNLTGEDKAYVTYSAQASPDGRRIAYQRSGGSYDDIWVMDSDGSDKHPLTTAAQRGGGTPTWSPDGSRIVFVRNGGDGDAGADIWTMAADGSDQTLFADEGGWGLSAPEWSPDGTTIAYVQSDQAAGSRIWTKSSDGGLATARTAFNDRVRAPSWSPDGSRILFWHDAGNVEGLYTMTPTGGDLTLVRSLPGADAGSYAWSPEGDRIAFGARTAGEMEVWVMDADGTDAQQVTPADDDTIYRGISWMTPPGLDPVALPPQVQGTAMVPHQLAPGASATFEVTAGTLPEGLALSVQGLLTGTPSAWGDHVFEVTATDGATPTTTAYSLRVVDPEDPHANLVSPGAASGTSHPVTVSLVHPVRWAGYDTTSDVATWDVRNRWIRWDGAAGAMTYPAAWQARTGETLSHNLGRGRTYCYSVRAQDDSGRVGAWSTARCTIAPLDQTSLARSSGWTLRSASAYFAGSALVTTRKGASLTRSGARLRRVGVLATTCPTCGAVDVYVGSTRVGRVNLARGTTTLHRKALLLPAFGQRTGTVRLVVVTSGRGVRIDGLLVGAR